MKKLPRYIVAIFIGLMAFAVSRYLFPPSPKPEAAQLECVFSSTKQAAAAVRLSSSITFETLEYSAKLTGKFVDHDGTLWRANGMASYPGGSQQLTGSVFLLPSGKVQGLSLYRDSYPRKARDLRISTLNENGMLDWNERSAFIYLEAAADKRAHAFNYRCNVVRKRSD